MKRADSLAGWEADPKNEGASLRPMPDHTGPQWDRLRYHFTTGIDNTAIDNSVTDNTVIDDLLSKGSNLPQTKIDEKDARHIGTDRDIVAKAAQRFRASGYRVLRAIHCECEQGILRLRGAVHSFFHLQLAQELVREIDGVQEFLIDLEVVDSGRSCISDAC